VNLGRVTLPNVISVNLDSFNIEKNQKKGGVNFSVDYRFYLPRENKNTIPHGLYIGPFYSYNAFRGELSGRIKRIKGIAASVPTPNSKSIPSASKWVTSLSYGNA
jgi:hypothetical protein